jgi:hypothetical protein
VARADTLEPDRETEPRPGSYPEMLRIKRRLRREAVPEIPGEKRWQREKDSRVAMLSALAFPGLGQLYNGRRFKAVLALGWEAFYVWKIYTEDREAMRSLARRDRARFGSLDYRYHDAFYQFHKAVRLDYVWFMGAFMLFNLVDVYVDAHLFDFRTSPDLGIGERDGDLELTASLVVRF